MDWKTLLIWLVSSCTWSFSLSLPSRVNTPGTGKRQLFTLLKTPSKKSSIPSSSSSSSLPARRKQRQKCCENGGLCVLGSFCHCPEKFYGYRCEYAMNPCGPVEHGQWAKVGCNLCRCFDASLHCFYQVYNGCDDQEPENETKIDINDYLNDLKIFPTDETTTFSRVPYDDYYNGNDYDNEDKKNKSSTTTPNTSCIWILTFLVESILIYSTFRLPWG